MCTEHTAHFNNPLAAHAHGSVYYYCYILVGGHALSKRRSGTVVKISDEVVRKELPSVAGYHWTNRSYSLLESPSHRTGGMCFLSQYLLHNRCCIIMQFEIMSLLLAQRRYAVIRLNYSVRIPRSCSRDETIVGWHMQHTCTECELHATTTTLSNLNLKSNASGELDSMD